VAMSVIHPFQTPSWTQCDYGTSLCKHKYW